MTHSGESKCNLNKGSENRPTYSQSAQALRFHLEYNRHRPSIATLILSQWDVRYSSYSSLKDLLLLQQTTVSIFALTKYLQVHAQSQLQKVTSGPHLTHLFASVPDLWPVA